LNQALAQQVLNEVRQIVRETLKNGTVTVYLFGSWARGNPTSLSDIDIAIKAHTTLPPGSLARLRERLEESHVPYRVDVVDLDYVNPTFKQRINQEGIQWKD
jgi:predicted nucleotidyltransferase